MITLTTRISLGLASLGLASMLGASPAHAGQGHGKSPAAKVERLCAELACTPAQKAKLTEIKAQGRTPEHKAARENLHAMKRQLQAEREKPSPNARTIADLEAKITTQKAALKRQREANRQQMMAVLTPAQKAKFEAHLAAKRERHGKGEGKGKRRGEGKGKRGGEGKRAG